jgi:hypothetical protein
MVIECALEQCLVGLKHVPIVQADLREVERVECINEYVRTVRGLRNRTEYNREGKLAKSENKK